MGIREARRLGLIEAAQRGEITSRQGAEALGISTRQFKRLRQRFRVGGAGALRHRGHGRRSPQRLPDERRARVVAWLTHPRTRLNDCHVSDLMAEEGQPVSPATVRRIRRELGFGELEPATLREVLQQRYQGSRYSFGYPACPNMADQPIQLDLLGSDRIAMTIDESDQLYPEQSTTAIIAYHPAAKYFSA